MRHTRLVMPLATSLVALSSFWTAPALAESFSRVATWPVFSNLPDGEPRETETAAEILAATADGQTLLYTDSETGVLGFVDIADPANPVAAGRLELGGEPTSVAVRGNTALVAVNTSADFVNPSGHLAVVDLVTRAVTRTCDVDGQPDAVAVSPDGTFAAVAIENERDEDLNDGALPQLPAGYLAVFALGDTAPANCDAATLVDLTGRAVVGPTDPEPEFVSINDANQAVVTLQENNHLAVVDLATGTVLSDFSAGAVSLDAVDTAEDDVINLSASLADVPREPDAVAWLNTTQFVTANEGDFQGGSRGFTIFNADGTVAFDSGVTLEHLAASVGHYPEHRSENKGAEPEGVAVGQYGDDTLIFVGLERSNLIAVFDTNDATPTLRQTLAVGVGPEGILPLPGRDLLAIANEVDDAEEGIRSTISLFAFDGAAPAYPTIVSDAVAGAPIGWGALSGLAADPNDPGRLYAVHDSFYTASRIYTIDVANQPARIVAAQPLSNGGAAVSYDLEGIAPAADGGFWLVSEGNPGKETANLLIKAAADGTVEREITLPDEVAAIAVRFGFEGVTTTGAGDDELVLVAIQREWEGDPKGHARIAAFRPADDTWSFALYPLDAPESAAGGWVGLSELVALDNGTVAVLERDNRGGPDAAIKRVYTFDAAKLHAPAGDSLPVLEKALAVDVLPQLNAASGWVPDKPEGMTVAADGTVYLVTDNDGIDGATGETLFLRLGDASKLFAGN